MGSILRSVYKIGLINKLILILLYISSSCIYGQKKDSSLVYQVDIANRFIWRGEIYNSSPILQGTVSFASGRFSLYGSGAYSIVPNQYHEINLGIEYTIFSKLTVGLVDYFGLIDSIQAYHDVFNTGQINGNHIIDTYIKYQPSDNFPLKIIGSTFIYGAGDLNINGRNQYSTYIEFSFPFKKAEYNLTPFIGLTPFNGFYANKTAIVNTGLTVEKTFFQNNKVSFPSSISFIINPYAEKFFVAIYLGIK